MAVLINGKIVDSGEDVKKREPWTLVFRMNTVTIEEYGSSQHYEQTYYKCVSVMLSCPVYYHSHLKWKQTNSPFTSVHSCEKNNYILPFRQHGQNRKSLDWETSKVQKDRCHTIQCIHILTKNVLHKLDVKWQLSAVKREQNRGKDGQSFLIKSKPHYNKE